MRLYHIKFFSVLPDKRGVIKELYKSRSEVAKAQGVEFLGLFYPRGSGYMYATITRHDDYASWERYWNNPETVKNRRKGGPIATKEMDMFFDEINLE